MNNIRKLMLVILLILAFCFGYYVRDLQQSKSTLKQERAERKIIDTKIAISNKNARALEKELIQVKQHEQNIISNTIQNQKMDSGNVTCDCFDDDFIQLYNNQNRIYERILSGKHD